MSNHYFTIVCVSSTNMPLSLFFFLFLYFYAVFGELFKDFFPLKHKLQKQKIVGMWLWKCVVSELQLLIVYISSGTSWERKADLKEILFTILKMSFLSLNSGTAYVIYELLVASMPKKQKWFRFRKPQWLASLHPIPCDHDGSLYLWAAGLMLGIII